MNNFSQSKKKRKILPVLHTDASSKGWGISLNFQKNPLQRQEQSWEAKWKHFVKAERSSSDKCLPEYSEHTEPTPAAVTNLKVDVLWEEVKATD